jgi:hypothetical protein
MLPMSAVSANVWNSGLMIIATLIGCLKKLATKCAASVREVNTRDQKYSVSRGFLKEKPVTSWARAMV